MIQSNYLRWVGFLVLGAALIAEISCSKSDNSINGAILGYAVESDQTDHSGITISLYRTVSPNQEISSAINRYDIIGFQQTQSCLFDHRLETASRTTTTNSNGQFAFQDIADGHYNVVAEDSGYGYRYALDLSVNGSETRADSLILYPIEQPASVIQDNTTWQSGHHYQIMQDVQIAQNATLTIEPGAVIRFAGTTGYTRVDVRGVLISQGELNNFVRWIRDDVDRPWNQIYIQDSGAQNTIDYNLFDGGTVGLRCSYSDLTLQNSMFKNCIGSGVSVEHVSDFLVSNCIFWDCRPGNGLSCIYVDAGEISYNVLYDNSIGFHCTTSSFPNIHGNWVSNCDEGMFFQELTPGPGDSLIVEHNQVEACSLGVHASGSTFGRFTYNNITNCLSRLISIRPIVGNYSNPIISFNNITNVEQGGLLVEVSLAVNTHDINATYNWWGYTSASALDNLIYDGNDPGNAATAIVLYTPMLLQPVPDAGITW